MKVWKLTVLTAGLAAILIAGWVAQNTVHGTAEHWGILAAEALAGFAWGDTCAQRWKAGR